MKKITAILFFQEFCFSLNRTTIVNPKIISKLPRTAIGFKFQSYLIKLKQQPTIMDRLIKSVRIPVFRERVKLITNSTWPIPSGIDEKNIIPLDQCQRKCNQCLQKRQAESINENSFMNYPSFQLILSWKLNMPIKYWQSPKILQRKEILPNSKKQNTQSFDLYLSSWAFLMPFNHNYKIMKEYQQITSYQNKNQMAEEYEQASKKWKEMLEINLVKDVLMDVQAYIETHDDEIKDFYGIGNIQDKEGFYMGSEVKWYYQQIKTNKAINNPYDLLSLLTSCLEDRQPVIEWYQQILKNRPLCYQLHYGLANAYFNSYKSRQAELHYKQAIKINPNFCSGYIGLAWIEVFRYIRFHKAVQYAEEALKINQNNFQAKLIVAGFHNSSFESSKMLNELKQEYPDNSLVLCAQAYYLRYSGPSKLIPMYHQAIQLNPNLILPYIYLAKIMIFESDFEKAQEYLDKAIMLNPKNYLAYVELSYLNHCHGKYQLALENIRKVLEINEEDSFSLYLAGSIFQQEPQLKDFTIAINYLQKCIEYNPFFMKAYSKLKRIYQATENREQFRKILLEELKARLDTSDPRSISETKSLIMSILQRKQLGNDVKAIVFQMIQQCSQAGQICQWMAEKQLEKGHASESIKYAELSLSSNPCNLKSLRIYAEALKFLERWPEALKLFITYLQEKSKEQRYILQKDVLNSLKIIFKNVETQIAIEQLEKLHALFRQRLDFGLMLAEYYQRSNRFKQGLNIYNVVEQFGLLLDSDDSSDEQNILGINAAKWRKLNMKGVYPKKQQIMLRKVSLLFKQKYYELLSFK